MVQPSSKIPNMVVARLRQHTAALHASVERRVDFLSPSLTPERYIRILQAFRAYFVRCELEMDRTCPERFREIWRGRRSAALLDADLRALGAAPDARLESIAPAPVLSDPGHWLGALYVIEGSMLGGRVIARHLEGAFDWRDGNGYSYFLGHGAGTAERWKAVCALLEFESDACNLVEEGAHRTFDQLNSFLEAAL